MRVRESERGRSSPHHHTTPHTQQPTCTHTLLIITAHNTLISSQSIVPYSLTLDTPTTSRLSHSLPAFDFHHSRAHCSRHFTAHGVCTTLRDIHTHDAHCMHVDSLTRHSLALRSLFSLQAQSSTLETRKQPGASLIHSHNHNVDLPPLPLCLSASLPLCLSFAASLPPHAHVRWCFKSVCSRPRVLGSFSLCVSVCARVYVKVLPLAFSFFSFFFASPEKCTASVLQASLALLLRACVKERE